MKKLLSGFSAVTAALMAVTAFAQAPGPMVFKSPDGSTLTLNGFVPSGPSATTSGSYYDNTGIGGCSKGATYALATINVSGGPNSQVNFKTPLCKGVSLNFKGDIVQGGPVGFTLNASWTTAATGSSQFTPQMPPGPTPPGGQPK